jgi:hypothetical protein
MNSSSQIKKKDSAHYEMLFGGECDMPVTREKCISEFCLENQKERETERKRLLGSTWCKLEDDIT